MNPQPKQGFGRLKGKKLKDQNYAIHKRDGGRCGCCRRYPMYGNLFAIHHNLFPQRTDIISEKISTCFICHTNLHLNLVWTGYGYKKLADKLETQEWVRNRIKDIESGYV